MRVTSGKSRVREICMPGSVRAKAKWLSYSTTILIPSRTLALYRRKMRANRKRLSRAASR